MRAAIYTRISQDREGRALGVERQEEDCRALAERLGATVARHYCDNDISASTLSKKRRPEYERMISDVHSGAVDVVLAYSSSRLTRRPREWEDLIELVDSTGVRVHFTKSNDPLDLSTARGRRHARDDAARDAEYAEEISENVRRAKEQKRQRGEPNCGGRRPFGFERDGVTPIPAEREMVAQGCRDVLAGRSLAAIGRDWGGTGAATVRGVLMNPRAAGMLPDGRPAVWASEAAVDEATWRGVVAVLSDAGRRRPARVDSRLLTGLALCGLCGATMRGGTAKGHATYRCSAVRHLEVACEPVDQLVREVVCGALAAWDVRPAPSGGRENSGALAARAAAVRARLDEAADMFASGELDRAGYGRVRERLEGELADLESRMATSVQTSALADLPDTEEALLELWDAADVHRRRRIVQAAPVRITINSPGRGARVFRPETVAFERLR